MEKLQFNKIFDKTSYKVNHYRIPSMVITSSGTIIACCDARFFTCSDNPNRIDKIVRRSLDGGKTWLDVQSIVDEVGQSKDSSSSAIDPALAYNSKTNTIFLLYSHTPAGIGILNSQCGLGVDKRGYLRLKRGNKEYLVIDGKLFTNGVSTDYCADAKGNITLNGTYICNYKIFDGEFTELATSYLMLSYSNDDGETWSSPICINHMVKDDYMSFIGAGPGIGIEIKNGKYSGRIVFPIYYNVIKSPLMLSCAAIFSDDNGKSWHRGKSPQDNRKRLGLFPMNHRFILPNEMTTESQIIERNDGSLLAFIRNHSVKKQIATAISTDGGESWHNYSFLPFRQPICQISAIKFDYENKPFVVICNCDSKTKRINGTLRLSMDDGFTFSYSLLVREGEWVYSSMAYLGDGNIGLLFETSTEHESIEFVKISVNYIIENGKKIE